MRKFVSATKSTGAAQGTVTQILPGADQLLTHLIAHRAAWDSDGLVAEDHGGLLTLEEPPENEEVTEVRNETPYCVDVMSQDQKRHFRWFISAWILVSVAFWVWWFNPAHIAGTWRFVLNTMLLGWTMLIPAYFFFFLARMKKTNPALPLPENAAVAMVITKAPSEPWPLVRETLEAALAQVYPHDTWLADEDPVPETIAWCRENGVQISTRKGVSDYHRPVWPRRTRCKEGNLAYFYDHHGYANYEFVVQMDADHQPGTNYLEEMIRPFADPSVGYVSAPSICDANAHQSWAVRGRLFAEVLTQGPLQAGYSGGGFAPLCIGSHYAVRTRALRDIGGLGPELAEDHSTTFLMNAGGWNGMHAMDADARGEGPTTFTDLVTQEFQWSKSLTKILLTLTPRHFGSLSNKLRFQFVFSQLWYVFLSAVMLGGTLIPPLALLTNSPWVTIVYPLYWAGSFTLACTVTAILVWIRRNGWLRPVSVPLISWEIFVYQFVRCPWVFLGVLSALVDVLLGRTEETFRVTPKGQDATRTIPKRALAPYAALSLISGLPVLMASDTTAVAGYELFAALNSLIYAGLLLALLCLHIRENR